MRYRFAILGASVSALALLALSVIHDPKPLLLYNASQSAPIGWYQVRPKSHIFVGDLVAARLPPDAQILAEKRNYLPPNAPIIKTVWAGPGTEYCVENAWLRTDGQPALLIQKQDRLGRILPALPQGCRRLRAHEFLLGSDRIPNSFDSRYFGPVTLNEILGEAVWLGAADVWNGGKIGNRVGARGSGADGKIKGSRAAKALAPCLHIGFYGAAGSVVALMRFKYRLKTELYHSSISPGFTRLQLGHPP